MSDQQPKQTPILDLLRDIPADARMVYEVNPTHHQSIPVGVLAHQAADEIDRLRASRDDWMNACNRAQEHRDGANAQLTIFESENLQLRNEIERLRRRYPRAREGAEMSDLIERLRDKTRLRAAHGLTGWVLAEEVLLAEAADEIERLRGLLCKCNMRTRLVGDGCEFCNPQLAEELAKEQR